MGKLFPIADTKNKMKMGISVCKRGRILIVDDELDITFTFKMILKKMGLIMTLLTSL
jgi:hypothetical protein